MASVDQTQFTFIKHRHFTKKRKLEQKPRNYTYISSEAKLLFLQLFLQLIQEYRNELYLKAIKSKMQSFVQICNQAANKAGIKYSSAKTILFAHRKTFKNELIRNKLAANSIKAKCCGYKVKQSGEQDNIQIISRIGM